MENLPFDQIERVDVPEFLFTRIQQRIQTEQQARFSRRTSWSLAAVAIGCIVLSTSVLLRSTQPMKETSLLIEGFQLSSDNTLYK